MATNKVKDLKVALQAGTDTTLYATWGITDPNYYVKDYSWEWRYFVSGTWFSGSSGTSPANTRSCTYSAPSNALKAQVRVIPNPKTYIKDNKETTRFTGTWSAWVTGVFKISEDLTPEIPEVPTVSVSGYYLTAFVNTYDPKTTEVQFECVIDNARTLGYGKVKVTTNRASFQWPIEAGHTYKVRARGVNTVPNVYGDWSHYSGDDQPEPEPVITLPAQVTGVTAYGNSETSAIVRWAAAANAKEYVVEYTFEKRYFDSSPQQVSSVTISSGTTAIISGLESGKWWFFRVKAVNDEGSSEWSEIVYCEIGATPEAPTTWSSTTTAIVGNNVTLYWIHNAPDGSDESNAQLELVVNGGPAQIITLGTIEKNAEDAAREYVLNTSAYPAGAKVNWRMRTMGILPVYGPWSTRRLIQIFAPPTLSFIMGHKNDWFWDPFSFVDGNIYTSPGVRHPLVDNTLTMFPLYIEFFAGPTSQIPVGYFLSITANESYTEVDDLGNTVYIVKGQEIFSAYYNERSLNWVVWLSAEDISFENGMSYNVTATVAMDSGLTATSTQTLYVDWADNEFNIDAEISIDEESITAYIRPYSDTDEGRATPGIIMSVYRREFDGTFTEIATMLSNVLRPTVTDPHPSLNYARYRIVGQSRYTGQVIYYDMPGYPMTERAIVIQWNEEWRSYDVVNEDPMSERPWSGSLLKLPYNVDVAEATDIDVEFINYIGRRHPVSYYGTQVGQTATWNADFDKEDEETIYQLRRLAAYLGNVYVREPSGTGYWAQIKVTFNQEHTVLVVPVTLEVTRVEGGA